MKIYRPHPALRPYVRYYWTLESDEPFSVLTFPIGCPQVIFHRRTPLCIPELASAQSRLTISGQVNFPAHIRSCGDLQMIVAVFYPHTAGMFIDVPPSSFYNLEISGYDIGNPLLERTAAKVFDCDDEIRCIGIIERWLLSKLADVPSGQRDGRRISASVAALMNDPSMAVRDLADTACLGKKQFERVFRHTVGMNPKEYARVVRFQKSLWMMQCGSRDYAGIAFDCGYSDQSHFIREFRAMSGHTPKSLLKVAAPHSDLFSNPL